MTLPNRINHSRIRPLAVKRCETGGFTLIELLVVIAIIALLVSILLPSLNRAKELARQAVCKTNLNGISVTSHIYVAENDAWWPVAGAMSNVGRELGVDKSPLWTYVLAQMSGIHYSTEETDYVGVAPYDSFLILNRYEEKDNGFFQCPSDDYRNYWDGPTNACSYGWNNGWSDTYGMGWSDWEGVGQGSWGGDYTEGLGRVSAEDVVRPADTFVVGDSLGSLRKPLYEEALTRITSTHRKYGQMADLHLGSGNYLWCDGHVSDMHPEDVLEEHFDRRR